MYRWTIIGGGIQGCTLAISLLKCGRVKPEQMAVIDPYDEPLSNWKKIRNESACLMKDLHWIHPLIEEEELPCVECGFPVISSNLEWTKGLYVMGALSELEIGPTARNISGAKTASHRIVSSIF
ncbi:hypothetical protein [Mesobacillus harenae]|uniref:hypothetical protein n=1 Tax=Mesobacillus harenae TaxID=2213203 RepID=UPI00158088B2|nr:hypothetical protein [Mesobacillus harenae]